MNLALFKSNQHVFLRWLIQISLTLSILASPLSNLTKTILFLVVWLLTFWPLKPAEIIYFFCMNLFFSVMDIQTLQKGGFQFARPDFLGMPLWEFFMWGFYLLATVRLVGNQPPTHTHQKRFLLWAFAIAFGLSFSMISDSTLLFLTTGAILALCLCVFCEKADYQYTAAMIILGTLVEYIGVWSGNWMYPDRPPGGVPLWFITMWGGVGFFARRITLSMMNVPFPKDFLIFGTSTQPRTHTSMQ
jgi:hypothetical protein